jgi:hypothetical protein
MRFERCEGAAEVPSTSVVEPWPLRLWSPSEAEKSGLLKVVLARFLMKEMRFSSKERSSLMLSLRATMRRLFRFSVPASIDLEPAMDVCVGGRGKGLMLSTLVASVANETQLLLSIVASRPRLRAFRRLSTR